MNKNIYGYGNPYNPEALRDLDKIKKEVQFAPNVAKWNKK